MPSLYAALQAAQSDPVSNWTLTSFLSNPGPLVRAVLLVSVGMPVAWGLSRWVRSHVSRLYNPQKGLIVGKLVFWPIAPRMGLWRLRWVR